MSRNRRMEASENSMSTRFGRIRGLGVAPAFALGIALTPGVAAAQTIGTDTSVDAQTWWPAAGPTDFVGIRSAMVSPSGAVGFGLVAHAMRSPLVLSPLANPTLHSNAVDYAITSDFLWSVGVLRRFQISAAIPVVLAQSGDGATAVNAPGAAALGDTALRDLRLEVSWAIVQRERHPDARGFGLRLDLGMAAPFGDDKGFNGSGGFTFAPMIVADWRNRWFSAAINAGARIRPSSAIGDLVVGHTVVTGAGIAVRPIRRLGISAEYLGTYGVAGRDGFQTTMTHEVFAGARFATDYAGDIEIIAGGAAPLSSTPLTPAWRAIVGVSYAPRGNDTDRDGVVDADDHCATASRTRTVARTRTTTTTACPTCATGAPTKPRTSTTTRTKTAAPIPTTTATACRTPTTSAPTRPRVSTPIRSARAARSPTPTTTACSTPTTVASTCLAVRFRTPSARAARFPTATMTAWPTAPTSARRCPRAITPMPSAGAAPTRTSTATACSARRTTAPTSPRPSTACRTTTDAPTRAPSTRPGTRLGRCFASFRG